MYVSVFVCPSFPFKGSMKCKGYASFSSMSDFDSHSSFPLQSDPIPIPYSRPSLIPCPFRFRAFQINSRFFFCFFLLCFIFFFWYGEDPVLFIFIVAFLVELVCSYIGFDLVAKIYLPVSQSTVSTVFIDPLSCGNISFISHINKVDNRGHFIRSLSVTGQFIHSLLNSKTD